MQSFYESFYFPSPENNFGNLFSGFSETAPTVSGTPSIRTPISSAVAFPKRGTAPFSEMSTNAPVQHFETPVI